MKRLLRITWQALSMIVSRSRARGSKFRNALFQILERAVPNAGTRCSKFRNALVPNSGSLVSKIWNRDFQNLEQRFGAAVPKSETAGWIRNSKIWNDRSNVLFQIPGRAVPNFGKILIFVKGFTFSSFSGLFQIPETPFPNFGKGCSKIWNSGSGRPFQNPGQRVGPAIPKSGAAVQRCRSKI